MNGRDIIFVPLLQLEMSALNEFRHAPACHN